MTSTLDKQFNQTPNCLCLRPDKPSHGHVSSRKVDYQENLTKEEQKKKEEIDSYLSKAMSGLTFEERQKDQEVLHGVDDEIAEEANLIENALRDLDQFISSSKTGTVYETAEQMNSDHVQSRTFRVMFLRGNRYNAKAAAAQMIRFFEMKQKLFGRDKLVKDITLEDLDQDDRECLTKGWLQTIGRDRSSRQIILQLPGLRNYKTLMNELRARYYLMMSLLQCETSQLRGAVMITYTIGTFNDTTGGAGFSESIQLMKTVPCHYAAMHFCTDEMKKYIAMSIIFKANPNPSRLQIHYGSHLECQYRLSTFGIWAGLLPFNSDISGNTNGVNLDYHLSWYRSCLAKETKDSRPITVPCQDNLAIVPNATDVLYIGYKRSNNGGNNRLIYFVKEFSKVYESSNKEQKRTIVDQIVADIHQTGGRFLNKTGPPSSWEELPLEKAKSKVVQNFRNYRHRKLAATKMVANGTQIVGEPLANDVVFGKTRPTAGSDLLHQLIKERSEQYETLGRGMKSAAANDIIKEIHQTGGRFLQRDNASAGWLQLSEDMVRARINKYFQNYRRPSKRQTGD